MSAKVNIGITSGILVLVIILSVIVITGSEENNKQSTMGRLQSEQNNRDNQKMNATLNAFYDLYNKRVQIGNNNTNTTQRIILEGIDEIKSLVKQEFANLTQHRLVTNATFDKIEGLLNKTSQLTGTEYNKLAEKKVESIIGNMTENFKILFKGLNITATDKDTASYDAVQQLKKQIEALENKSIK